MGARYQHYSLEKKTLFSSSASLPTILMHYLHNIAYTSLSPSPICDDDLANRGVVIVLVSLMKLNYENLQMAVKI